MAASSRRVRLARSRGVFSRSTTFDTPEALEEQEIEGYDVSLRRVRYDEVLLVTRHTTTNWIGAIVTFFFLGLCFFWSLLAGLISQKVMVGVIAFSVTGIPLLVVLVLMMAVKVEVITVFGRRMRIRMRFWLGKARASQVFDTVCRAARQRQEADRRQATARTPSPDPFGDLPMEPSGP
jgi:hypothetical protein